MSCMAVVVMTIDRHIPTIAGTENAGVSTDQTSVFACAKARSAVRVFGESHEA